jgi:hypothetical protein
MQVGWMLYDELLGRWTCMVLHFVQRCVHGRTSDLEDSHDWIVDVRFIACGSMYLSCTSRLEAECQAGPFDDSVGRYIAASVTHPRRHASPDSVAVLPVETQAYRGFIMQRRNH